MATDLQKIAADRGLAVTDRKFASALDEIDPLAALRDEFEVPKRSSIKNFDATSVDVDGDEPCVYLVGNSLGLQPKRTRRHVTDQLDKWARLGLGGHFEEPYPWYSIGEATAEKAMPIVGAANVNEVAIMNSLTTNLHLLMVAFYKPTATRHKIVIEGGAFPSDRYAAASQIRFHGYDPKDSLVQLRPRPGEELLRTEDILAFLDAEGESVALLMLSGVQFYTGQFFEIPVLTEAAHKHGCIAGFDLAHAVGNVPLSLHDWGVDFACWCSYKYLNSGAGGIAGAFVHERHANDTTLNRFAGWWGNDPKTRFDMSEDFIPLPGAPSFQLSNPPVLQVACFMSSMEVFEMTSMEKLREKSLLLTGYLELLVNSELITEAESTIDSSPPKSKCAARSPMVEILTPSDEAQRGCQLSLKLTISATMVHDELQRRGVVVDVREPSVIRVAPVPLYNTFTDVYNFVTMLKDILAQCDSNGQ